MSDKPGFIIPTFSPSYFPPPWPMQKFEALMVEFEANPEEISRITVPPLERASHNRLTTIITDNRQMTHDLHYHEAFIMQDVSYEGEDYVTTPYLWVSTDTAMNTGRELYGMPKLLCDDTPLEIHSNEVFGTVSKYGHTMMEANIVIDRKLEEPPHIFSGVPFIFVRLVPSPDPDYPALKQIVKCVTSNFEMKECWGGKGWLNFHYPSSSSIDKLNPINVLGAWYGSFTFVLEWGKILKEERVKQEA